MAGSNPPNRVYETMTRIKIGRSWSIRVWRQEDKFKTGPDEEVIEVVLATPRRPMGDGKHFPEDLANSILSLPRISAIEIIDKNGDGGLLYPDWK